MKLKQVIEAPGASKYKYIAIFYDPQTKKQKSTGFGAKGYSDYTIHHDKQRRERYRIRHEKDLRTNDPTRAGFLSYYLLWGQSISLQQNIKSYKQQFHL
jgi:hypothetical protein